MTPLTEAGLYRDAAAVRRYHTKRTIRQQSVGEHTFNVLMLIQQVAPGARKEVLLAVMHHDLPELHTGDIPAPIKRLHPELGPLMDQIESELAPLYRDFNLTADEKALVKWADTMELVMWCFEEYAMGNHLIRDVLERGMAWIMESAPSPDGATLVSDPALYGIQTAQLAINGEMHATMRKMGLQPRA